MKNTLTFGKILQLAHAQIKSMNQTKIEKLTEQLEHWKRLLTSNEQLDMYLHKYGEIHQDKLLRAFEHIPHKLWVEGAISVVDYGCGQGIAAMVLSDYLKSQNIDNDIIKDITLIEPSRSSLIRCMNYLGRFYDDAKIKPFLIDASHITQDYIKPESNHVLHIFSNVLDPEEFDFKSIADILKNDVTHNNIIVCVSPFYQEDMRGKRMDTFGNLLQGYYCSYKFQKHIDEWVNDYSCQIRIYISSYY